MATRARVRYVAPTAGNGTPRHLVFEPGTAREERLVFYDTLEIGRLDPGRTEAPGVVLVDDRTVSFRHCVITQHADGRCTVRDVSRNGTRLDGRRLVPNVETVLATGQSIEVAQGVGFVFVADEDLARYPEDVAGGTVVAPGITIATVLVGDVRDYTVMVREAPSIALQQSMSRLFERLTADVQRHGGTVKEYQGDAIFAFWEGSLDGRQAVAACRAVLELHALVERLAIDPAVWDVPGFPLGVDWAMATGPVVIDAIGGSRQRAGLSMIGEAVVKAFRLEKFATLETGPILACEATHRMAAPHFTFNPLGERQAKGFDRPDRVFALVGAR